MNNEFFLDIDLDDYKYGHRKIEKLNVAVQRGFEEGILRLGVAVENKIKENLTLYGLGDSTLASSINIQVFNDGISINMNSDYAMFVEFGTGIMGSNNPHPTPQMNNWIYDTNNHGEKGWFYPTTNSDPNPYKKYYNGKLYAWTKGQASRPFMFDTWVWANANATKIVNKWINKEVRKVSRQ